MTSTHRIIFTDINKPKKGGVMRNPLKRILRKPSLKDKVFDEISDIRKGLDKELSRVSKELRKQAASLEKRARKLNLKGEFERLSKTGFNALTKDLRKRSDKAVEEIRKDYKAALKRIKAKIG